LVSFLVRKYVSWEELLFAEEVLLEEKEKKEEYFLYANRKILSIPSESISVSAEGYYTHPEFSPISRTNYKAGVNFPEDLTSPIDLFTQFFSREQVEDFVTIINKYAIQELQRKQTEKNLRAPKFSRRRAATRRARALIFKLMIIRKAYIFLSILIYMGFEKIAKFKNY
jgi:hypothetical protein